jgi:hypothetical protein
MKLPTASETELFLLQPFTVDQLPYKFVVKNQMTLHECEDLVRDSPLPIEEVFISVEESHLLIRCCALYYDHNFFETFSVYIPGGEGLERQAKNALPDTDPFKPEGNGKSLTEIESSEVKHQFYVDYSTHQKAIDMVKVQQFYSRVSEFQGFIKDAKLLLELLSEGLKNSYAYVELVDIVWGAIDRDDKDVAPDEDEH